MGDITKKQLADELRPRESVKALRCELDFVTAERRSAESRTRDAERRIDVLEHRFRDMRAATVGLERSRSRIQQLLVELEHAKNDLTAKAMLLDLPPGGSGHAAMNDFIAGPVVDGRRSARG